ncbi:hypothetical protein BKA65DRAFT_507110 [Rhexocercosporidium sp. MPI-PUGE-AT-0058]|nr:hypothetical protein BKA65DRAFT_507110 [Rhexocercosporidium sp. MPI-PUGE-AT-0058]
MGRGPLILSCWNLIAVMASSQTANPLQRLSQQPSPTPLHAEYKRNVFISEAIPSSSSVESPTFEGSLAFTTISSSPTLPNLTLASQIFSSAPAETVFIFSGDILAESHPITLLLTSKTCTQNPIVSITASITTLPVSWVDHDGVTSSYTDVRCMVFGSGGRSSTYSAEGTGGWGSVRGRPGLVWTFTDSYTRLGPTTQNPWGSGTAMWINPIPTTLPRFVVEGNRTVQFGGSVNFGNEMASVTTDERGGGWLAVGETSATVPGWPMITKGPVVGSDLGGAYPLDGMVAGGAALIETQCCSICQNASQAVTASTKAGTASLGVNGSQRWYLWLSCWAVIFLNLFQ